MLGPEDCRIAVERTHGGRATFRETVRVVDTFRGQTAWEGDVHVFDLAGNPRATEAYAWPEGKRIIAVLKTSPVDGPLAAVRGYVVAEAKRREIEKFGR